MPILQGRLLLLPGPPLPLRLLLLLLLLLQLAVMGTGEQVAPSVTALLPHRLLVDLSDPAAVTTIGDGLLTVWGTGNEQLGSIVNGSLLPLTDVSPWLYFEPGHWRARNCPGVLTLLPCFWGTDGCTKDVSSWTYADRLDSATYTDTGLSTVPWPDPWTELTDDGSPLLGAITAPYGVGICLGCTSPCALGCAIGFAVSIERSLPPPGCGTATLTVQWSNTSSYSIPSSQGTGIYVNGTLADPAQVTGLSSWDRVSYRFVFTPSAPGSTEPGYCVHNFTARYTCQGTQEGHKSESTHARANNSRAQLVI